MKIYNLYEDISLCVKKYVCARVQYNGLWEHTVQVMFKPIKTYTEKKHGRPYNGK